MKKTDKILQYLSSQNLPTEPIPNWISEPTCWPKYFPNSVNGLPQIFTERKQNCTELASICHHRATGENRDRPKKMYRDGRGGLPDGGSDPGPKTGRSRAVSGPRRVPAGVVHPPKSPPKKERGGDDAPGSSGGGENFFAENQGVGREAEILKS